LRGRELLTLLLAVASLAALVAYVWWGYEYGSRVTTPGCLEAPRAVIVAYQRGQGMLAELMVMRLSAMWAGIVPRGTMFCIAHASELGLEGYPVYPAVVVRGDDVARALEGYVYYNDPQPQAITDGQQWGWKVVA